MAGIDLASVQYYLGHSDIKMTLRYSHLAPSHKKTAVNVLDSTINLKPTAQLLHSLPISDIKKAVSSDGNKANCLNLLGGAERDRTVDLLTASQALSQLSYSPTRKANVLYTLWTLRCQPRRGGVDVRIIPVKFFDLRMFFLRSFCFCSQLVF